MDKTQLLKIAIEAAIEAGKKIMDIYNKGFHVEYKEDNSPVTEADLASNKTIWSYLQKTGIPIISEETKQLDYRERKSWEACWIVDPLDGTKEFVKKNDEFAVNIALVENAKPVLGIIYAPALGLIYYTNPYKTKAYKCPVNDDFNISKQLFSESKKIVASKNVQDTINVVASRSHLSKQTVDFIGNLQKSYSKVKMVSKGSALKFCLVAEGEADLYPRFAPTMEWDTAAGQAICEAVGLQLIDAETKSPMVYNRPNLLNNYFLVSPYGFQLP